MKTNKITAAIIAATLATTALTATAFADAPYNLVGTEWSDGNTTYTFTSDTEGVSYNAMFDYTLNFYWCYSEKDGLYLFNTEGTDFDSSDNTCFTVDKDKLTVDYVTSKVTCTKVKSTKKEADEVKEIAAPEKEEPAAPAEEKKDNSVDADAEDFQFKAGQVWAFTPDDETAFYFGFTSATGGYRYDTMSKAYAEFTLTTNKDGSFTLTTGKDKLTFTVEQTSENTLKVTGNDTTAFWYSYNDILDIDSFLTIFNEEVKKYLLPAGTYKLTKVNSDTVKYLTLTTETEGVLESADGKTSVPFTVEQDIYEGTLTFHFGGVDDTTVVRVDTANDILTFDDGNYRLMPISSEDQDDTVEDPAADDNDEDDAIVDDVDDATVTPEVVTTTAATSLMFTGDEIASAFEKSGNDTILYITLTEAKPFAAKLIFKTTAGGARTYTIEASGKDGTSYFTLQDALTALNLKASDITTLEVDSAAVKTASLTKRPAGVVASAASGDENPATGVSLAVIPAAFAGVAAFFTRKRK